MQSESASQAHLISVQVCPVCLGADWFDTFWSSDPIRALSIWASVLHGRGSGSSRKWGSTSLGACGKQQCERMSAMVYLFMNELGHLAPVAMGL